MLRALYVTDVHGDERAYAALPGLCRAAGAQVLINGGDMLPKGGDMMASQRAFLGEMMPRFLDGCAAAGVAFYGLFGNDDLRAVHGQWLDLVRARQAAGEAVFDMTQGWYPLPGGLWIGGSSFVPDYPFGLKDWCLRDMAESQPVPPLVPGRGRPVVTGPGGVEVIGDVRAFFAGRPTIGEHLDAMGAEAARAVAAMERSVLVHHAPPAGVGLATLWSDEDVGSLALRRWIERRQPLLTLSGHIHESPDVEARERGQPRHTARVGRTVCHQPGQVLPRLLAYSVIELDLEAPEAERVRIDWRREAV